jgi:hypothetical protein
MLHAPLNVWLACCSALLLIILQDKEETPRKFVIARLALEFLQLWLLIVNPDFGWNIDTNNKWVPSRCAGTPCERECGGRPQ